MKTTNNKKPNSFAKQAHLYKKSSLIQSQIVQMLLDSCDFKSIYRVMDIGCGCGAVALQMNELGIKVDEFYALDIAQEMISQHPKKAKYIGNINLICEDFEKFVFDKYDIIFAASSLQWAENLDSLMCKLAKSSHMARFAIHTNKSLDSIHHFLGTSSPLRDKKSLEVILHKYFEGKIWTEKLEQIFDSREEFLSHLKDSGLLGGGVLSFSQARYFRNNIPYAKAEYEVLMFAGVSKLS